MKLIEQTLIEFSADVNSNKPAPGGGSVAAYVSNLGIALARMMGHLSISKKKFLELDEADQASFMKVFNEIENAYQKTLLMVDEDTESFNKVMAAFTLPKESDEDKVKRSNAIQSATLEATKAPLEAAFIAFKTLQIVPALIKHGNVNAISDLASGIYLLEAGMNCSILNVKINAGGLKDRVLAEDYLQQCTKMQKEARIIVENNMAIINEKL